MTKLAIAALAAFLPFSAIEPVRASDFTAEVTEWVIEPCMDVAAAIDVKSMKKSDLDLGIKREHIAKLMVASREAATRDLAAKMRANAPWENRRQAYPLTLKLCLAGLPGLE